MTTDIDDLERNIYGWEMRVMQLGEDIFTLNKRLEEFELILKSQRAKIKELKGKGK